MKRNKISSFTACLMAAIMLISAASGLSFAFGETASADYTIRQMDSVTISGTKINSKELIESETEELYADDEMVTFIAELESDAVLESNGTMSANNTLTGRGEDIQSEILKAQGEVAAAIRENVFDIDVRYNFTLLINAISFDAPYGLRYEIEKISGIENLSVAPTYELPQTEYAADSLYPTMYSAGDMMSLTGAWDLGYTGKGTLVAVVDSGLYVEHEAFSTVPESPKFSKDEMAMLLESNDLQAEKLYTAAGKTLTVDDVYYNGKIVFKFDYNGVDTDVGHGGYDDSMDHGTHVTGIIAAVPTQEMNGIEDTYARGMAPEVQIAAMKVFSDHSSGASWDTIIAAIEDSIYIGADVVNLSLGSPSGFPEQEEQYDKIYSILDEHGISVMTAAGNDTSSAYDSTWGTNFPTASNADSGIVNSPATYEDSLAIAAVYNTHKYYTDYIRIGGNSYGYTDSAEELGNRPDLLIGTALGGQTLEMVAVPGYGTEEDYKDVDVTGKVAFVIRGNGSFASKMQNAANNGAIAMVVYDSKENNLLTNMQIDAPVIPAVFVSHNNGLAILESIESGDNQLYISDGTGAITAMSNGGVPADFSSWGPRCDLAIKPELSAPGGNIMSTVDPNLTGEGQLYGSMSGTSMATPATAGAAAIVRQYVNEKYPDMPDKEKVELINTLLMCTAVPLKDKNGVEYSVRKQGAGMLDLRGALTTRALITVDNCVRPKLELGSDSGRTGEYTLNFNVENFGDESLTYKIEPIMITSGYVWTEQGKRATNVTTLESTNLTDKMAFTTNCADNTVTIAPGATEKITVTMKLDASTHELLKEVFPYGTYIEGYCYLRSVANEEGAIYPDLSVCYLGYYGDWSEVPVVDQGFYYNEPEEQMGMMAYPNTLGSKHKATFFEIGMNPYFDKTDESEEAQKFSFLADRCSISPVEKDRYYDAVDVMYTGIMRNLKLFYYSITDSETGEVYWERATPGEMTKNISSTLDMTIYPMGYAINRMSAWKGTDVPEGTTVLVRCGGEPYMDNFNPEVAPLAYWEMPVTVDNTAPQIVESWSEGSMLYIKIMDNHYAAYAGAYVNESDEEAFAKFCISENERGAETVIAVDMNGKDKAYLLLGDYACNEAQFEITAGQGSATSDNETYYELVTDITAGSTYLIVADDSLVTGDTQNTMSFALSSTPAQPNNVRLQGIRVNSQGNRITGNKYSGIEWVIDADGKVTNADTGEFLGIAESNGTYWLGTTSKQNASWTYEDGTFSHNSNLTDAKMLVYAKTIENSDAQFDLTADSNAEGTIKLYRKVAKEKQTDIKLYATVTETSSEANIDVNVVLSANSEVTSGIVTLAYDDSKVTVKGTEKGDMLANGSAQFNTGTPGRIIAAFNRDSAPTSGNAETVFTANIELNCGTDSVLMFEVLADELYKGDSKVEANTECAVYGTGDSRTPVNVALNAQISSESDERILTFSVNIESGMSHTLSGGYVVTYDPNIFEYDSGIEGRILSKYDLKTDVSSGRIEARFTGTQPSTSDLGCLAMYKLQIKSGVPKGTEIEIGLEALDFTLVTTSRLSSLTAEGTTYKITTGDNGETPTSEPTEEPTPPEIPDDAVVMELLYVSEADKVITLSLNIREESKAASGVYIINYDPELLEFVSHTAGAAGAGMMFMPNTTVAGEVKVAFAGTEAVTDAGGEIASIKLKIKDSVENGTKLEISLTVPELLADDSVTELKAVGIGCTCYAGGAEPTETPTEQPTEPPTERPTEQPTEPPTEKPTERPTEQPTAPPTERPTEQPTAPPTERPTEQPTEPPTEKPTEQPTEPPTEKPTEQPTEPPTEKPTEQPTEQPTEAPGVPGTGSSVVPYAAIVMAVAGIVGMSYSFIKKEESD